MIIQNSLKLLENLTELEKEISYLEQVIEKVSPEVDSQKILKHIIETMLRSS